MVTPKETNTVDQEATLPADGILKAETEDIPIIAATEDLWIAEEAEVKVGMTIKEAMGPTEMTDPA